MSKSKRHAKARRNPNRNAGRPKGKGMFVKVRKLGASVIMTIPLNTRTVFKSANPGKWLKLTADKRGFSASAA